MSVSGASPICSICSETLTSLVTLPGQYDPLNGDGTNSVVTPCGHVYHAVCIKQWMKRTPGDNGSCPNCRKVIPAKHCLPLYLDSQDVAGNQPHCGLVNDLQSQLSELRKRLVKATQKSLALKKKLKVKSAKAKTLKEQLSHSVLDYGKSVNEKNALKESRDRYKLLMESAQEEQRVAKKSLAKLVKGMTKLIRPNETTTSAQMYKAKKTGNTSANCHNSRKKSSSTESVKIEPETTPSRSCVVGNVPSGSISVIGQNSGTGIKSVAELNSSLSSPFLVSFTPSVVPAFKSLKASLKNVIMPNVSSRPELMETTAATTSKGKSLTGTSPKRMRVSLPDLAPGPGIASDTETAGRQQGDAQQSLSISNCSISKPAHGNRSLSMPKQTARLHSVPSESASGQLDIRTGPSPSVSLEYFMNHLFMNGLEILA